MSPAPRRSRHLAGRLGITLAVAAAVVTPAVLVAQTGAGSGSDSERALLAATAWHDWVDGQRAPQVVPPGDTESAIIVLDGDSITDTPEADRAAALTRIQADQLAVEASVQGMGGLVTQRYRTLINGLAVRVPTARLAGLGEIPGIAAVVPVQYLAPGRRHHPLPPLAVRPPTLRLSTPVWTRLIPGWVGALVPICPSWADLTSYRSTPTHHPIRLTPPPRPTAHRSPPSFCVPPRWRGWPLSRCRACSRTA